MDFLKRLFRARLSDEGFSPFLRGWECELRSSSLSPEALWDEVSERFFEHFPSPPDADALLEELYAWTERRVVQLRAEEQSWVTPSHSDRLSAAFEALRASQLIALEGAGVSIQDGWARVGSDQRRAHRGAVFFHQQDVLGALRGDGLLLAFGAFDERPHAPSNEAIGRELFDTLATHGLTPSWSGDARERIELAPFVWQKRRWTTAPEVVLTTAPEWTVSPIGPEKLVVPEALRAENAAAFAERVTAVRSSAGCVDSSVTSALRTTSCVLANRPRSACATPF